MKFTSIKISIINVVISLIILVFSVQACYSLLYSKQIITNEVKNVLKFQAEKEAFLLFSNYSKIEKTNQVLAENIANASSADADLMLAILKGLLQKDPLLIGGGIWMEPYSYDQNKKYFGPYMYKDFGKVKLTWNYNSKETEYFQYDWYKNGIHANKDAFWTDPYVDTITPFTESHVGMPMITVSAPILRNGQTIGITTLDVALQQLEEYTEKIKIGKTGYAFIISQNGYYIGHKSFEKNQKQKITEDENENLRNLGNLIQNSTTTTISDAFLDNRKNHVVFTKIGDTSMKLVMVMPDSEISFDTKSFLLTNLISLLSAIIIFIIFLSLLISKKIIFPLSTLLKKAEAIGAGDFTSIPEDLLSRKDELGSLSISIDKMSKNLKIYINEKEAQSIELNKKNKEIHAQNDEISALYEETAAMNDSLNSLIDELKHNYLSTISALVNAIEAKDKYTKGHCERVTKYALAIGIELNLSEPNLETLQFSGLLHDVGKIGIRSKILNKSAMLTEEEYIIIKSHPQIGFTMLKDVEFLQKSRQILVQHHERIDGKGYPFGLKSEQIDELAKILAVADCFDAMTSSRPYRSNPLSNEDAIEELIRNKETQFDGKIVDIFVGILKKTMH